MALSSWERSSHRVRPHVIPADSPHQTRWLCGDADTTSRGSRAPAFKRRLSPKHLQQPPRPFQDEAPTQPDFCSVAYVALDLFLLTGVNRNSHCNLAGKVNLTPPSARAIQAHGHQCSCSPMSLVSQIIAAAWRYFVSRLASFLIPKTLLTETLLSATASCSHVRQVSTCRARPKPRRLANDLAELASVCSLIGPLAQECFPVSMLGSSQAFSIPCPLQLLHPEFTSLVV